MSVRASRGRGLVLAGLLFGLGILFCLGVEFKIHLPVLGIVGPGIAGAVP